ncbi:hypothetical protein P280DRAFT_139942 [Massarina eburnea CBS 473.64]|uniref:Uncharacterized protein n=1 Tax=Massarina eburnea CBS 473.64 TaxID=1395130 RepID=A0A6A6RR67_9PLEO|nr:hypothetical protein P280DRAFT_139942 [Massarina eburnea CBS 473.64]
MVDQNMSPNQGGGGNGNEAKPTQSAKPSAMEQPSVVQAGQAMLIFALVLIFLVCCAIAVHLHLRRKRRRRRKQGKNVVKKKAVDEEEGPREVELHSKEKKIAELVGTPVCEMGDPEPRHEMEDAEVRERRYTIIEPELQNPADNPVVSPLDREPHGVFFGEMDSAISPLQAEARIYAAYWARAL